MKPTRHTSPRTPFIALALLLSLGSFAVAQESAVNAAAERNSVNQNHDVQQSAGRAEECAKLAHNESGGAVATTPRSNPNAPADVQGSRGQTNPSAERANTAQLAQIEEDCLNSHEDPTNGESTSEHDNDSHAAE